MGQFWYFFSCNKNLMLKMLMPLNIQSYTWEKSLLRRHSTSVLLYSSCFYSSRLLSHLNFLIFHRLSPSPHMPLCPAFYLLCPFSNITNVSVGWGKSGYRLAPQPHYGGGLGWETWDLGRTMFVTKLILHLQTGSVLLPLFLWSFISAPLLFIIPDSIQLPCMWNYIS